MDSFHNWMIVWTVVSVLGVLVGAYVFWYTSKRLARHSRRN